MNIEDEKELTKNKPFLVFESTFAVCKQSLCCLVQQNPFRAHQQNEMKWEEKKGEEEEHRRDEKTKKK